MRAPSLLVAVLAGCVTDDTNRISDVFVHDVGQVRPLLAQPLPGLS